MRIEIICTGDEVLSGKIVNTNFSYMTQKLEDFGLGVAWGTIVGDDRDAAHDVGGDDGLRRRPAGRVVAARLRVEGAGGDQRQGAEERRKSGEVHALHSSMVWGRRWLGTHMRPAVE